MSKTTTTAPDLNNTTYQRYERLSPLARSVLGLRWKLAQPLQGRVPLLDVTVGEILLGLPIVLLLVGGISTTFFTKDVAGSGGMAALALVGTFVTANKASSPITFLLGIPFERMIPYHGMCAKLSVLLGCFHGYAAYVHKAATGDSSSVEVYGPNAQSGSNPDLGRFFFSSQEGDTEVNQWGSILLICMVILVFTSIIERLRRWFFEGWLLTHILASVGVVVFSVMHKSNVIIFVAIWWIIDLAIRYVYKSMFLFPRQATLRLVHDDIVEVRFPKPAKLSYTAGQFVQVCLPAVSLTQFHAFTISSAPHQEDMTLHIRALGGWSTSLVELMKKSSKDTTLTSPIMLEGPYGNLSMDLENEDKYQMALLVSGGIGVTPCLSVGKMLLHQHETQGRPLERLTFVWAVPSLDMARNLPPPQPSSTTSSSVVSTDVYVTRPAAKTEDEETPDDITTTPDYYTVHEGRPDWDQIFDAMKTEAQKKEVSRVAIIACGPTSMLKQVRAARRQYTDGCGGGGKGGVTFDLHEEKFEF